ncbi:MAG: sugar phosphate isomerase/epimerase [Bryobacterales bacterium]|nr:sugar phosphate isomerase/epimerase [Bryobacterales bacterium]
MNIGSFALLQPFAGLETQFRLVRAFGLDTADITDNHDGATLGVEYGFSASVSLDSHPEKIRRMAFDAGVRLSAFCAHANLLDPFSPDTYSTFQIIKAIRLAHLLDICHVITTEGEPRTEFGHSLSREQAIFAVRERLYEPIRWAEELGVELLLETHGHLTDSVETMSELLDALGHPECLGICLDTGNCWLGGEDPLEFVRHFGSRIRHVHWKDMGEEWVARRGTVYGCGMGTIPLGDGLVGVPAIVEALKEMGFTGDTTIEVAGPDNVRASISRLQGWLAASPLIEASQ